MEKLLLISKTRIMCRLFQTSFSKPNLIQHRDCCEQNECTQIKNQDTLCKYKNKYIPRNNFRNSICSSFKYTHQANSLVHHNNVKYCHTSSNTSTNSNLENLIVKSELKSKHIVGENYSIPNIADEITEFLEDHDISFNKGYLGVNFVCPSLRAKKSKRIHASSSGHYYCENCQKYGAWSELKESMESTVKTKKKKSDSVPCLPDWAKKLPNEDTLDLWQSGIPLNYKLYKKELDFIMYNLAIQEIELKTLVDFHAIIHPDYSGLILPVYSSNEDIIAVKTIKFEELIEECEDDFDEDRTTHKVDIQYSIIPSSHVEDLVGWHLVKRKSSHLIITSNDLDAMAIYQNIASNATVISVSEENILLPLHMLPKLEQFEKITIWFGNDEKSWARARWWSEVLDVSRCHLVRHIPSALMALRQKLNFKNVLNLALPAKSSTILTFSDMQHQVRQQIENIELFKGVQWLRYGRLNNILKGHRRGELSVLTGRTGCGKTTLLSDMSLDLATQGVNTLWGSFEISNPKLASVMLSQYSNLDMSDNYHRFKEFADQFAPLPIYFMSFFGQERIDKVIETMKHAVYIHDIDHVIIDNLQFMMGCEFASQINDKYLKQDMIISKLRHFATSMDCHVTLVIHPKKEKDGDLLTISSVYGSGKATQEADNVFIIQEKAYSSTTTVKYLEVVKNRYDGTMGRILIKFDKKSKRFCLPELPKREKKTEESSIKAEESSTKSEESSIKVKPQDNLANHMK